MLVDVVLPCWNEAAALPWVLDRLPADARAIVVDNGSTDGSADIARRHGASVVPCTQRGYGSACQAGLAAATADLVAFCDCDGTIDPRDVMVAAGLLDAAELVVARRRPVDRASWTLPGRVANRTLARFVSRRTGQRLDDLGPLRVAATEPLRALQVRHPRSGYPVETVVRAAAAGWRIAQVDVDYFPRVGDSKVTGTVPGYLRAVRDTWAVLGA